MPQIVIDYSATLDAEIAPERLLHAVHASVVAQAAFDPLTVRTRMAPRALFLVADGDPAHGYITVTMRMRPGRSAEVRKAAADAIHDAINAEIAEARKKRGILVSVELIEMDVTALVGSSNIRDHLKAGEPAA